MEKTEIIYGTRAVIEAVRAGQGIEKIFIQSGLKNNLIQELIAIANKNHVPISFVPQQKINRISSKNHQGVLCLLSAIPYAALDHLIDRAYSEGTYPFFLILDRITDVRNFGALARTAECAGLNAIVISGKGSAPITGDAVKASAGALHHLPICKVYDVKLLIRTLKEHGIKIIACTEKAKKTLYEIDLASPMAWIMGSEENGISDSLIKEADALARIPVYGKIESLNVSVSAGIALYEVIRQKHYK